VIRYEEFILVLAIAGLVWFWVDTLRARERAVQLCRDLCRRRHLQLLDETVALHRLSVGRDHNGRVRLRRNYRFEFTRDGSVRDRGTVVMLGALMESIDLPEDGGRLFEHGEF
jgi:hypothetical protein